MKLDELMRFAGRFFEQERADYFVFGATAMNFWIPPRNTVDLDIVVCVDKKRCAALVEQLRKRKIPITATLSRMFLQGRLIKVPLGDTELDLKMCKTRHEREALSRSKSFSAGTFTLRIATPEDLVLFKLQYWRRQDQADVERMLELRGDLDVTYITSWLERLEADTSFPMTKRWQEIRGAP